MAPLPDSDAAQQRAEDERFARGVLSRWEDAEWIEVGEGDDEAAVRDRLGVTWESLFRRPIGPPLFGWTPHADLYGVNPLRSRRLPGGRELEEMRAAVARRLSTRSGAIRLGYDGLLPASEGDSPSGAAIALEIAELFWPHLPVELFDRIATAGTLYVPELIPALVDRACGTDPEPRALARHALAVLFQNAAIAAECRYVRGLGPAADGWWRAALGFWRQALGSAAFWRYLTPRWTDPRGPAPDTPPSEVVGAVVLGFNRMFAAAYAARGDLIGYHRHSALIESSGLAPRAVGESSPRQAVAARG
jgi:hypothetical protein